MTRRLMQASGLIASALAIFSPLHALAAHPAMDIAVKNWSFTPSSIETHVGEATTLRFNSSEGVHGVESTDIALSKTTIVPGKITEVTFTPTKAGTFTVHCAIMCGEGHDKMTLVVKVLP